MFKNRIIMKKYVRILTATLKKSLALAIYIFIFWVNKAGRD
jgi:hypothetical protein